MRSHAELWFDRSPVVAAANEQSAEIARICWEILEEEEAMARWLEDLIPEVTCMVQQVAHA